MVDYDKILFSSQYPIDKVVATGEFTVHTPAPSGAFYYNSGVLQTDTIANPYGKKCYVRYVWSTNFVDYAPPESIIEYGFNIDASGVGGPATNPINGVKSATAMGVSDSTISFMSYNGLHGNVTYTFGNDIFTGVALDFHYKYALFEVE